MSPEALALGLLSAVRAVPLAIVYSLLLTERPSRLLVAYIVSGFVVTVGVGVMVVTGLQAASGSSTATGSHLLVDLVLGVLGVVWAALRLSGREVRLRRLGRSARRERGRGSVLPEALDRRLRAPTVPVVGLAGVVTNLPGLYFLAALVAILQTHPTVVNGIGQVLVYGLLRFAVPVAALVLVLVRPDRTLDIVQGVHDWGRRNARVLTALAVGSVGCYLAVKGLVGLLG